MAMMLTATSNAVGACWTPLPRRRTPEGEIVWEYWSREVLDGKRRGIYRMLRLPRERVEAALPRLRGVFERSDRGSPSDAGPR